jgi:hypothetical protein
MTAKKKGGGESHIQIQNNDYQNFVMSMSDVTSNRPNFNTSSSATHMGVPVETRDFKLSCFSFSSKVIKCGRGDGRKIRSPEHVAC